MEELAKKIQVMLKKETEGGTLQTVPLEMFIQLIEMEQKTATIRVFDKATSKKGVLFFRDGELLDARLPGFQGKAAAYEIFSWDEVSLAIQDTCAVKEKKIEEELQAILLDAMRLKDEAGMEDEFEEEAAGSPKNNGPLLNEGPADLGILDQSVVEEGPKPDAANRVKALLKNEKGVHEIYQDNAWNTVLEIAGQLGSLSGNGELKTCFISKGTAVDTILVPGKDTTVVLVDSTCMRDRILDALAE